MKQLFLILALLPITLFAQKQTGEIAPVDTTVYNVVEKMPEYPGGISKLASDFREYRDKLYERLYPDPVERVRWMGGDIRGRVIVSVIVHEDGQITDPVFTRTIDPNIGLFEKEALKFIKSMPRWIPGESRGKKVKVRYTLPFLF